MDLDPNQYFLDDLTTIFDVIRMNDRSKLKEMISEEPALANKRTINQLNTPLHIAVISQKEQIVKYLISLGE